MLSTVAAYADDEPLAARRAKQSNKTMLTEAIELTLFPGMMAFAASSDLLTMTIANRVSLILIAGFALLALCVLLLLRVPLLLHTSTTTIQLLPTNAVFNRVDLLQGMTLTTAGTTTGRSSCTSTGHCVSTDAILEEEEQPL